MFAVLWIRIYYYADPDPGSKKCPYGSGSGRPFLMRIRADPDPQHCKSACTNVYL